MTKQAPTTVSLTEAATMTGRPQSTIRDWLKKGQIEGTRDEKGRWQLTRISVVTAAATAPTAARSIAAQRIRKDNIASTIVPSVDPTVAKYVDSLQETIQREREENRELRARIRDFEQERTQHMAEMRALLNKDTDGFLSRWIRR
jgi:vacuolar-type H+-ATPase subunit I/STV1